MEISVLLSPVLGNGYRASVGEPFGLSADGATREEALGRLREQIEEKARSGTEVVRLHVALPERKLPPGPAWPDDEITRAWLEGIAEYRRLANERPDPWDEPAEPESSGGAISSTPTC